MESYTVTCIQRTRAHELSFNLSNSHKREVYTKTEETNYADSLEQLQFFQELVI